MAEQPPQSVLRRKTGTSQPSVGPTAMDAQKAIRVGMARAGDAALGVTVSARNISIESAMPESLTEVDASDSLLLVLRDPAGGVGLAMLCAQSLGAIIEASTLGAVFQGEASDRRPTFTDSVLAGPLIDAFLSAFEGLAEEITPPLPIEGFRTQGTFGDMRAVIMALDDDVHKKYSATLDFGLGAKIGTLMLFLPVHRAAAEEPEVPTADVWGDALHRAVMGTHAELNAELARIKMPLSKAAGLQIGDVLPLGQASISGISLMTGPGKPVARGKLGRAGGLRAVRVQMAGDEEAAPQVDMGGSEGLDFGLAAASLPAPDAGGLDALADLGGGDLPALGGDGPQIDIDGAAPMDLGGEGLPMADLGGLGGDETGGEFDGDFAAGMADIAPLDIGDLDQTG